MKSAESKRWEFFTSQSPMFLHTPELISMGYDRFKEALPLNSHKHGSFEFVYIESGKATWEVEGNSYESHSGQFFHTRPNEWHRARFNHIEPSAIWWVILLDPSEVPGWLGLRDEERLKIAASLNSLPRIVPTGPRILERFRMIRSELQNPGTTTSLKVRHGVLDMVIHLLQPASFRPIPDDLQTLMFRLTEKINRSPEQRWTNRELAEELGVSESHFYRLFRDVHGQSPASYLDRLRIEAACRMLGGPDASVISIAMDLGYKTSQHFATVFKKYTGMTPSQWRTQTKNHLSALNG